MKNILLVDDDANLRKTIRLVLEAEGYNIEEAAGIYTAQKKIKSKKPDLILLDVLMYGPQSPGEFASKLESSKEYSSIKIIYVSAVEGLNKVTMGKNVKGTVKKPFKNEELISKIKKVLAGK